jgi:hypothetical protein
VGEAGWSKRTGQKCIRSAGLVYCLGGAHQNGTTYLQHDVWTSKDATVGHHVSSDAWGCDPKASSCGKDDLLLLERDGELWTFGGDGETGKGPGAQDNSIWRTPARWAARGPVLGSKLRPPRPDSNGIMHQGPLVSIW